MMSLRRTRTPGLVVARGERVETTHRRRRQTSAEPLRVAFPFARHSLGGSTVSGARLARTLHADGLVEPWIIAHSNGPAYRYLKSEGLPVEIRDGGRHSRGLSFVTYEPRTGIPVKLAALTVAALRWLSEHSVDIVHANDDMAATAWGIAARIRNVPLVWHIRQPRGHRNLDRFLARQASYMIFVADANRGRFATTALPPNTTVYNGMEPSRYTVDGWAPPPRATLRLDDDLPVLGFVGNLIRRKRPERAVEVSSRLRRFGLAHHLIIVGADYTGGRYTRTLRARAEKEGWSDYLHVLGERTDVPTLMQAFDCFLLCSDAEAFGLVIIEAMAAGTPVVATSVDGVPEIIAHGRTGLLAAPEDVDAMATHVHSMLTDRRRAEDIGEAGQRAAINRFSVTTTAKRVYDVYEDVMRVRRGSLELGRAYSRVAQQRNEST